MNKTEEFVKQFCRPLHFHPQQYLLDGFDHEFCIVFDAEHDPEIVESWQTVDICFVPLPTNDILASKVRIVANADKYRVMRMLSAIGIQRFDDITKTVFFGSNSVIRKDNGGSMPTNPVK